MASAITWFMAFFSSVFLLLKHLFRWTETETEKDTIAVMAAAEAAVAAAEAAMAATTKAATIASEYASAAIAEQSKAAVAAAEAAIGDAEAAAQTAFAAVSAAQAAAAAAAAGLTNHGGDSAALKSQSVSGYSARKHLRALKGLMKMLAYVREYLVSEQATTSLYSMQTPIKARAIVRSQTKRRLIFDNINVDSREDHIIPSHSRRLSTSLETCFNTVNESPKIVKVDPTYMTHTQSFKAKLRSYRAPKQRPELKTGSKSSFRANLRRVP